MPDDHPDSVQPDALRRRAKILSRLFAGLEAACLGLEEIFSVVFLMNVFFHPTIALGAMSVLTKPTPDTMKNPITIGLNVLIPLFELLFGLFPIVFACIRLQDEVREQSKFRITYF